MRTKLLTKSRFTLALDCPTKLYYYGKTKEYADNSLDNGFLRELAKGGYQVGSLAQCYYPEGVLIESRDYEESVKMTEDLLNKNKNITVFEAAFRYKNLFIRADIVNKAGNRIQLIEVKAKSFDPEETEFLKKREEKIAKKWKKYIYDTAFQKYVLINYLIKEHPEFKIETYLMLADKSKKASIDGLNQMFFIKETGGGRYEVIKPKVKSINDFGDEVLSKYQVDDLVDIVWEGEEEINGKTFSFEKYIESLAKYYENDEKIKPSIGKICKGCQFNKNNDSPELKSGFDECWTQILGKKNYPTEKPLILDIWNFGKKDDLIKNKRYFFEDILMEDLLPKGKVKVPESGIGRNERQWIQVQKALKKDNEPYIDINGLKKEMNTWKYPLHFIDFETTATALPFNKGLVPYEGVAFQFSHHTVDKNGNIEHKGQYISDKQGFFPNFEFVRELKKQLDKDDGTIFRYATHENTYLRKISQQLQESNETDKDELCKWVDTITEYKIEKDKIAGNRNMVDMCALVVKYYYNPLTGGSNSLKYVLPATIETSDYLRTKYSEKIYGKNKQIKSLNFDEMSWIQYNENGKTKNPYDLLPGIFNKETDDKLDRLFIEDVIDQGGAAMTAYAKMQFSMMTEEEREKLKISLLKYCELDTFAMVLIWEYWKEITK